MTLWPGSLTPADLRIGNCSRWVVVELIQLAKLTKSHPIISSIPICDISPDYSYCVLAVRFCC